MGFCLFLDSTKRSRFNQFCCRFCEVADFWSDLSSTVFYLFVRGIQNSSEDQRKVKMLWTPREIWFWPAAESAYSLENAQFGLYFDILCAEHMKKNSKNLSTNWALNWLSANLFFWCEQILTKRLQNLLDKIRLTKLQFKFYKKV